MDIVLGETTGKIITTQPTNKAFPPHYIYTLSADFSLVVLWSKPRAIFEPKYTCFVIRNYISADHNFPEWCSHSFFFLFSFQNYLTAKNMFSHCPASVSPPNRRCWGKVKMLSDKTSISKPVCQEPVGVNAVDWLTLTIFQTVFVCLRHSHKVSRVVRRAETMTIISRLEWCASFVFFFQRQTVSLQPVSKIEDVLYHYKPLQVETYGPPVPELEQLGRLGYSYLLSLI